MFLTVLDDQLSTDKWSFWPANGSRESVMAARGHSASQQATHTKGGRPSGRPPELSLTCVPLRFAGTCFVSPLDSLPLGSSTRKPREARTNYGKGSMSGAPFISGPSRTSAAWHRLPPIEVRNQPVCPWIPCLLPPRVTETRCSRLSSIQAQATLGRRPKEHSSALFMGSTPFAPPPPRGVRLAFDYWVDTRSDHHPCTPRAGGSTTPANGISRPVHPESPRCRNRRRRSSRRQGTDRDRPPTPRRHPLRAS